MTYEEASAKIEAEIEHARKRAFENYGITDKAEENAFVIGWLSGCLRTCMLELANEREQKMSRMRKARL